MIDEQRTLEIFGYTSDNLKPKSNKLIVGICDECGKYRVSRKVMYRDLCVTCSNRIPEKRKRQSEANRNRPPISEETRQKMVDSHLGKKLPEEQKRKIGEAGKGRTYTKERNRKLSESKKGITFTEEHKRKLSAAKQGIDIEDWKDFAKEKLYCSKFNNSLKEQIRNKYNRECFICGKSELDNITSTDKQRKLSVHHINMNKNQGCDGNKWKLIPVCMSCHSGLHNKLWESRLGYLLDY